MGGVRSPLLAVLLVASSPRGSHVVFQWPRHPRRAKRHSRVRYYADFNDEMDGDQRSDPELEEHDSDETSVDSDASDSSEDSFNEEVARIRRPDMDPDAGRGRDTAAVGVGRTRPMAHPPPSPDTRTTTRMRSRSASRPAFRSHVAGTSAARPVSSGQFFGFDVDILATFLSPRPEQCHQRFELAIDEFTFLGYPVRPLPGDAATLKPVEDDDDERQVTLFNLVLVLDTGNMYPTVANVDLSTWVNLYYTVLFKATALLAAEEVRCQYVTSEMHALIQLRDEVLQSGDTFEDFLSAATDISSLARALRDLYRDIARHQNSVITINGTVKLDLQLPLLLRQPLKALDAEAVQCVLDPHDPVVVRGDGVEPRDIASLTAVHGLVAEHESVLHEWARTTGPFLRPWQTLLLPQDANTADGRDTIYAFCRPLIEAFRPTPRGSATFAQAAERLGWDLHRDVYPMVRHLIYYTNARVMDVLRLQNIYAMDPTFDMATLPAVSAKWALTFPSMPPLPLFLERVSAEVKPFAAHWDKTQKEPAALDVLVWLLRHEVLLQLRVHLRFLITEKDQLRAVELRKRRRERQRRQQAPTPGGAPDAESDPEPELFVEKWMGQRDHVTPGPERPQSERQRHHHRHSRQLSNVSTSSTDTDWTPHPMPHMRSADFARDERAPRADLDMDFEDEDDRFDDLLPLGVPHPVMIAEPSRANRTESEWISAMLHGKHLWYTRWFIRLFPYLNGKHSIDEIVCRERIRRRDLKLILTEFEDNLLHFYHP